MIINVDLDGVVDDFHRMLDSLYYWHGRVNKKVADTPVWEAWEWLGISKGEFNSMIRRGVEAGKLWHDDPIIPGAREYLWRLSDDGCDIRIVTTRLAHKFSHSTIVKATADWLERQDIPYRSLCFLGPHESKGDYRADYGIDDNFRNVAEMREEGINAVIFDRPWNQRSDLPRVYNWKGFYEYVLHNN